MKGTAKAMALILLIIMLAGIIAAQDALNKRTAGGFLTNGVGGSFLNPRDVALAGHTMRGGGGFKSRAGGNSFRR